MQFSSLPQTLSLDHPWLVAAAAGKIPHAQLLVGSEGSAAFALAVAYAQSLLCSSPLGTDSCGQCASCVQVQHFTHPDIHFSFPFARKEKMSKDVDCDTLLREWLAFALTNTYPLLFDWMIAQGVENKQLSIPVYESRRIVRKLSMKSYSGGKKIAILWMPEKFNEAAANKLLKTIEEPEGDAVLLLITHDEEALLSTLRSRCQRLFIPPVPRDTLTDFLKNKGIPHDIAMLASMNAGGSPGVALQLCENPEILKENTASFALCLRAAYRRSLPDMFAWSDAHSSWVRERQKSFFLFALETLRDGLAQKHQLPHGDPFALSGVSFSFPGFAQLLTPPVLVSMAELFESALRDIQRNANSKIVLFDTCLALSNALHSTR